MRFDGKRGEGVRSLNAAFLQWADGPWDEPRFAWVHYMDPHSPYLPPGPFERIFYQGDECDPKNKSMKPVFDFAPFAQQYWNSIYIAVVNVTGTLTVRLMSAAVRRVPANAGPFWERRLLGPSRSLPSAL